MTATPARSVNSKAPRLIGTSRSAGTSSSVTVRSRVTAATLSTPSMSSPLDSTPTRRQPHPHPSLSLDILRAFTMDELVAHPVLVIDAICSSGRGVSYEIWSMVFMQCACGKWITSRRSVNHTFYCVVAEAPARATLGVSE